MEVKFVDVLLSHSIHEEAAFSLSEVCVNRDQLIHDVLFSRPVELSIELGTTEI